MLNIVLSDLAKFIASILMVMKHKFTYCLSYFVLFLRQETVVHRVISDTTLVDYVLPSNNFPNSTIVALLYILATCDRSLADEQSNDCVIREVIRG